MSDRDRPRLPSKFDHLKDKVQKAAAEGMEDHQIAKTFGISPSYVRPLLRRWEAIDKGDRVSQGYERGKSPRAAGGPKPGVPFAPSKARDAIALAYEKGIPFVDAAKKVGVYAGTVHTMASKIRNGICPPIPGVDLSKHPTKRAPRNLPLPPEELRPSPPAPSPRVELAPPRGEQEPAQRAPMQIAQQLLLALSTTQTTENQSETELRQQLDAMTRERDALKLALELVIEKTVGKL